MEREISVEICTGTTCYVMGASDLLTIEDFITEPLSDRVRLSGSTCLGMCKDRSVKPPFARVNGKLIPQATIEKVIEAIHAYTE